MNESKATRYQRLRRRARAASVGSAVLMLAVVALTPAARGLAAFAESFASGLPRGPAAAVSVGLFIALVVALWEMASLPAVIYLSRRVDPAYGQTAPTVEDVFGEHLQSAVVVLPAALSAGGAVVFSVYLASAWWWVAAGPMLAALLAAALHAAPLLFRSLGDVRPLDRPALTARVRAIAERARVRVAGIDEWVIDESAAATALVTGVGSRRRVLVSSEIARRWSDDEAAVVLAHELAHHVYHDLWRTFGLQVVVLWGGLFAGDIVVRGVAGGLGLSGPGDLAALPLIALVTAGLWILAAPLRHAQSRRHERRADAFALAMTGGVEAFGAAVTRLAARRLAEDRPSRLTRWFHHSHPPVAERLALAEAYRRARHPPIADRR